MSDIDSTFDHGSQAVVCIRLGDIGEAELVAFHIYWRCVIKARLNLPTRLVFLSAVSYNEIEQ